MKIVNFGFRNPSTLLLVVCCLAFLLVLAGCGDKSLLFANWLEKNALKHGTISVGAVRVTDYNDPCLATSRQRLINTLCVMEANVSDANIMPQSYTLNENLFKFGLVLGWGAKAEPNKGVVPKLQEFNDLSSSFYKIVADAKLKPSEIEMVGLRMATRKFIESEIEDLNLSAVYPVDSDKYRRVVISLDLAAWVLGEAKAALVYIDLYPYRADIWCHEAGDVLKKSLEDPKNKNPKHQREPYEPNKEAWDNALEILDAGFYPGFLEDVNRPKLREGTDCIAKCHVWLEENRLCPRIIQVERMKEGEYLISAEGGYSGFGLQAGGGLSSEVSASIEAEAAKKDTSMRAKVQPCSLAFVAGNMRAGWLFMPLQGRMRPTERRLRMVVDVPKNMTKLGIHVHKLFLDSGLHVIPSADFLAQGAGHWLNQWVLVTSDSLYERLMKTDAVLYGLVKTRIRNLLSQGWSEEIVVDIPDEVKKRQQ